jgi:hypothetical protein
MRSLRHRPELAYRVALRCASPKATPAVKGTARTERGTVPPYRPSCEDDAMHAESAAPRPLVRATVRPCYDRPP